RQLRCRYRREQEHRDQHAAAGGGVPASTESAAAFGLLLRHRDRPFLARPPEQALRRRTNLFVQVDAPEPPAEQRFHCVGGERIGHAPRLDRTDATAWWPPPSNQAVLPFGRTPGL